MSPEVAILVPGQNTPVPREWAEFPPMKDVMRAYDRVAGTQVGTLLGSSPESRNQDVFTAHRLLTLLVLSVREYVDIPARSAGGHSLGSPLSIIFIDGYNDVGFPKESVVRLVEWRAQVQQESQDASPGEMYPFIWKGKEGFSNIENVIQDRDDMWVACYNTETPESAQAIVTVKKGWDAGAFRDSLGEDARKNLRVLKKLDIDLGAHSPLVKEAASKFAQYTRALSSSGELKTPRSGSLFVSDHMRNGEIVSTSLPQLIAILLGEIDQPVRFQQMIEEMYYQGGRQFIEIGSTTLSEMIKRMNLSGVTSTSIVTPRDLIANFPPKEIPTP